MSQTSLPIKNLILAGLPHKEYARLLPDLESVPLPPGEKLYKSGDAIEYVYFPGEGLVSLVTHMKDGTTVEVGLIGRDGMVGIPVLLGDDIAFEAAVVQVAGTALRMPSAAFKEVIKGARSPLLTRLLLYTRVLMKQVAQTAACNGRHAAEKRLARWLLMTADRAGTNELPLTHEFISYMVGGPRSAVTEAAAELREAGAIDYRRALIEVRDRAKLRAHACECYDALQPDGQEAVVA